MIRLALAFALLLVARAAAAQAIDFAAVPALTDGDTLAAAGLSEEELGPIILHLERTSFDIPDSWDIELRMRRVAIGKAQGLIVRGSDLLCGGTGNCATWLFRRDRTRWTSLLEGEALVVASVGFARHVSHDLPDLVVVTHKSAAASAYAVYVFDGTLYRRSRCYDVAEPSGEAGGAVKQIACR